MNLHILHIILLITGCFIFYKIGWFKRNQQRNNAIYKEKENFRELYEIELANNKIEELKASKRIIKYFTEIEELKDIRDGLIKVLREKEEKKEESNRN